MTDEQARLRATEYVLQQYHLSSLQEAQQRLAPRQYEGVLREIDAIHAQLVAPPAPRPQVAPSATHGINTPFGPLLPVTGLLLAIIWIVFIFEEQQPGGSQSVATLVTFGATTPDVLATHQYWRFLTACFLHIGIAHIATNSLALLWLGGLAERFYGPLRYLGIYLAAGVAGNLLGAFIQPEVGAGASGAIFGLLGAMLIASWRNRAVLGAGAARRLFSSLGQLLVLNIVISFLPGIGWSAHLGGAIAGGLLALFIPFNSPRWPRAYAVAANVLSAVLIVASLALGVTWVGNHAVI
jgi:rhomboid protease GluP